MSFVLQVFPDTFQIIGRIGHEQVWDYIDKLRTSSSKVYDYM